MRHHLHLKQIDCKKCPYVLTGVDPNCELCKQVFKIQAKQKILHEQMPLATALVKKHEPVLVG